MTKIATQTPFVPVGCDTATMGRRHFLFSMLVTGVALGLGAFTRTVCASKTFAPGADWTLYDARFRLAREMVGAMAADTRRLAVAGDGSDIARQLLVPTPDAVVVAGVTTDAVPFCVEGVARRQGRVRLDIDRFDGDLFVWQIQFVRRGPS
jgi:hypothetical protein